MLLKNIVYVVEKVSIFGRTTAVVRLHSSWYAHAQQVMCMRWSTVMRQTIIQTYDTPSSGTPSGLASLLNAWRSCAAIYACWSLKSVKSGEEWVKSRCKLFTPRNADKHRGFRRKGEEWRVKACSLAEQKNRAQAVSMKGIACAPDIIAYE